MADSSLGRNKKHDNRTSENKYKRTHVRRKLFNSVEPSEQNPPFSKEWCEAGKTALTPNLLRFSLPFSPQTAVAHKEYQKVCF
jgi:hypothetical protein